MLNKFTFEIDSKAALRIFSIFCISVEENGAHWLSQIVYLKKS